MTRRILCVDDEINILQAFERQFHRRFELFTAQGPERGLEQLSRNGPFAVVVSDLRMPSMDGIEFLRRVREKWPDTVRIMLTGQADLTASIAAVNQGNIFQFLTKPCPADMLGRALDAALEQHRLITSERELLEKTLSGSIGVMSEILSLVNPVAFSRAGRLRRYVLHIVKELNLGNAWQYELAAMLSQIGCVAVPQEVLSKYYDAQPLSAAEKEALASQRQIGYKLLVQIPRLEEVAEIVGGKSANSSSGSAFGSVKTGARILQTVLDFDEAVARGSDPGAAIERMRASGRYPAEFMEALQQVEVERCREEIQLLRIHQLKAGMVTNSEVYSKTGVLLMGIGQEITDSGLARLLTFSSTVGIEEPVSVRLTKKALQPEEQPAEVPV